MLNPGASFLSMRICNQFCGTVLLVLNLDMIGLDVVDVGQRATLEVAAQIAHIKEENCSPVTTLLRADWND